MSSKSPIGNLILLPGMDGTGTLFGRFIDALPEEFRAVSAKYPTDRALGNAEMRRTVEMLFPDSGRSVLVAESYSTPLAIQIAATHPPGLAGLVLCAGFAMSPLAGVRRIACRLLAPLIFRIELPQFAARRWLVGTGAPHALVADVQAAIRRVKPDVLSARLREVLDCDVRAELAQVDVPVLYISAANDRLIGVNCADEIVRIKPQIEMIAVDGPHLLLQSEPDNCAEVVTVFVRGLG
jgi:pimeloyl-ACP methyl ester carboxylesterase